MPIRIYFGNPEELAVRATISDLSARLLRGEMDFEEYHAARDKLEDELVAYQANQRYNESEREGRLN